MQQTIYLLSMKGYFVKITFQSKNCEPVRVLSFVFKCFKTLLLAEGGGVFRSPLPQALRVPLPNG